MILIINSYFFLEYFASMFNEVMMLLKDPILSVFVFLVPPRAVVPLERDITFSNFATYIRLHFWLSTFSNGYLPIYSAFFFGE